MLRKITFTGPPWTVHRSRQSKVAGFPQPCSTRRFDTQTECVLHTQRCRCENLTCELDRINERLGNEITKTLPAEFGDCSDWTSIAIYSKLLKIVAITSGSVFFGPEHCRDEKLIQLTVDYANALFMSISRVKEWKPWTRWFGQFFIKELKDLQKARHGTEEYLIPIIQERRRNMAAGKETSNDCMQWMIKEA